MVRSRSAFEPLLNRKMFGLDSLMVRSRFGDLFTDGKGDGVKMKERIDCRIGGAPANGCHAVEEPWVRLATSVNPASHAVRSQFGHQRTVATGRFAASENRGAQRRYT